MPTSFLTMNFTWEQEPLENLSESVPDLELGPGLLTPIPVLCSLQTAPLALRAGLMTLSLVVEGKEKVTLGLWASIQGTFPAGPTEVSGTRSEGGPMVQVSSCRKGLSQPPSSEKRYPFQHRACSIIY